LSLRAEPLLAGADPHVAYGRRRGWRVSGV
jgi:hypothetical protein